MGFFGDKGISKDVYNQLKIENENQILKNEKLQSHIEELQEQNDSIESNHTGLIDSFKEMEKEVIKFSLL